MKKILIIFTSFILLVFGSTNIYAEEGTQGINVGASSDIEQPFNISNTTSGDLDSYNVTISWIIDPLEFSIANDSIGDTYYYNPTDETQTNTATFKVTNNSKRLIKVTSSFNKNSLLDSNYISYQYTKDYYGLADLFEETPGTNEDFSFFVVGSLLGGSNSSLTTRTITSDMTVNALAFKNYTGSPTGNIGQYHFTIDKTY